MIIKSAPKLIPYIIILLISGFHIVGLSRKEIWLDELLSVIYASGNYHKQVYEHFFNSTLFFRSTDIREYLMQTGSVFGVLKNLTTYYPLQSPIYYLFLRMWIYFFGIEPFALGGLSVCFHFLLIILAANFFIKIFNSSLAWAISIMLVALGPIEVTYAREARPYILLMVLFFSQNILFFRAFDGDSAKNWKIYTGGLIFSLYSSLLAIPFWVAHLLFLVFDTKTLNTKRFVRFCYSSAFAFLSFFPWVYFSLEPGLKGVKAQVAWLDDYTTDTLGLWWKHNMLWLFYRDPRIGENSINQIWILIAAIFLILLTAILLRGSRSRVRSLFLYSALTSTVPLLFWDLYFGGIHSAMPRYQLPTFLMVQLGGAAVLDQGIQQTRTILRYLSFGLLFLVVFLNLAWNIEYCLLPTHPNSRLMQINEFIRLNPNAIFYVLAKDHQKYTGKNDASLSETLSMLYNSPKTVKFKWIQSEIDAKLIPGKSTFLYLPTGLEKIEKITRRFPTHPDIEGLWRLE